MSRHALVPEGYHELLELVSRDAVTEHDKATATCQHGCAGHPVFATTQRPYGDYDRGQRTIASSHTPRPRVHGHTAPARLPTACERARIRASPATVVNIKLLETLAELSQLSFRQLIERRHCVTRTPFTPRRTLKSAVPCNCLHTAADAWTCALGSKPIGRDA